MVKDRLLNDEFLSKSESLLNETKRNGTITFTFKQLPEREAANETAKSNSADHNDSSRQQSAPQLLCHVRLNNKSQYSTAITSKTFQRFNHSLNSIITLAASDSGLLTSKNDKRNVRQGTLKHKQTQKKQRIEARKKIEIEQKSSQPL